MRFLAAFLCAAHNLFDERVEAQSFEPVSSIVCDAQQPQGNSTSQSGRIDGSLNNTLPTAASFVLGVGWGTTASVAVQAGSTDQRGEITVTSAGTGQAQATATVAMTFADGPYAARPFAIVELIDNSNAVTEAPVPQAQTRTVNGIGWTHPVLPVATKTYKYAYVVIA